MNSLIKTKDWSTVTRRALNPTEIVANLALLDAWTLNGEGATLAIEKTYAFSDYYQTIAFVNALAFVAHVNNHHPELAVFPNRCIVRFNTHDVNGISGTDFDCASAVDALLK